MFSAQMKSEGLPHTFYLINDAASHQCCIRLCLMVNIEIGRIANFANVPELQRYLTQFPLPAVSLIVTSHSIER